MLKSALLLGATLALWSSSAIAGGSDFRLHRGEGAFFGQNESGQFEIFEKPWRLFATELAFALAPRLTSPADTLGYAGFHVGAAYSGTFVSSDKAYWQITDEALSSGKASSLLSTLQLELKKGLPLSFEIGASLSWLADSQIFSPGLEVRWAYEADPELPDFAIRTSFNHMVGNRDMVLNTLGFDFSVSKAFGIWGETNITPYFSWALLFIAASSQPIDPTPLNPEDTENNLVLPEMGLGSRVHQRLTFGARLLYSILHFAFQVEVQAFGEDQILGPVVTLTSKLGIDF